MKKTIGLVLTAVILLMIASMPAMAAELPTPWTDDTMKIWVADDLTGSDSALIDESTEKSEGVKWIGWPTSGLEASLQYKDNALRIYYTSAWTGNLQISGNGSGSLEGAVLDGAAGIGMYIENNTENVIGLKGHMYTGAGFFEAAAGSVYYVIENGRAVESNILSAGYLEVPVGFKGYYLFPLENLKNGWSANAPATAEDAKAYKTDLICLETSPIGAPDQTSQYLLIDDIFIYGKGITDNTAAKGNIDINGSSDDSGNEGDTSVIWALGGSLPLLMAASYIIVKKNKKYSA